jgi:hypothetical protein
VRSRLIDLALILSLVAVGAAILWTLFNLGANQGPVVRPPVSDAGAAAAAPAPATATPPPAGGVVVSDRPSDPQPAGADVDAADSPLGTEAPLSPREPAAPPLPDGVLALERIGFSYANGATGACGFVLEAWTHVAVSRELLASFGCGAAVRVTLDDPAGGRSEMVGIIGDTMNPSFERTVNIYVSPAEDAFAYGLTAGTFSAR